MRAASLTGALRSAFRAVVDSDGRLALFVFVVALAVRALNYDALSDGLFLKYPSHAAMYLDGQGEATRPFTASPLYLFYWIAVAKLLGGSIDAGRVLQIAIGSANCALMAVLGKGFFNAAAGLIAGLAAALYLPFIVHDGSFVSATVVVFLNLCALLLLGRARGGSWAGLAVGALLLGLSACARPNALLLAPFFGAWALWGWGQPGVRLVRRCAGPAALFGGLVLLPALLVAGRNYRVSGDFVPVMSDGGIVFYLGNNEMDTGFMYYWPRYEDLFFMLPGEVDPTHRVAHEIAERELGRPLTVSGASSFWTQQGLRFIRERPVQWLWLVVRKLAYTWTGYEAHDVADSFDKEDAISGRFPWLSFAVVGSIGLVGAVWFRRRLVDLLPLYGIIATYTLTGLLFTVVSRYRIPMLPALVWLAAGLAVELWQTATDRGVRFVLLPVACVACLFGAMSYRNYPMRALTAQYRIERDHLGPAEGALLAGRLDEAETQLQAVLAARATFMTVCRAHGLLAVLYERLADVEEARQHRQIGQGYTMREGDMLLRPPRGLAGDPVSAQWEAGVQHFRAGRMEAASRAFATLCSMVPNLPAAQHCYGLALVNAGKGDAGLRRLRLARLKDPANPATHRAIVNLSHEAPAQLVGEYRHLVSVHRGHPGFRLGLGLALYAAGDRAGARAELESAAEAAPELGAAMRSLLQDVE